MSNWREWCKHCVSQDDAAVCQKGIQRVNRWGSFTNWPCFLGNGSCELFKTYSKQEVEEIEKENSDYVRKLWDFDARKTEDCPNCGQHVDGLSKVGRCVYARPCGCRLWQGTIPAAWRNNEQSKR